MNPNNPTTWGDALYTTRSIYRFGETSDNSGRSRLPYPVLEHDDRKSVLLLLDQRAASSVAVQRASSISDGLGARLLAVQAIPDGTATVHPALRASRIVDLLRPRPPHHGFDVEVVAGSLEDRGAEIACTRDLCMVVVDASLGARVACRLANRLEVPVLVARDARPDGEWIAASGMQHLGLPVLALARDVANALDREVLYVHNASPVPLLAGDPIAGSASYVGMLELQETAAAAKRARLDQLAEGDERAHSLVTRAGSTVEVLVELVCERDADAIVIGTHPRSWWSRLLGRGTAEELVEKSPRSVLIVPVDRSV